MIKQQFNHQLVKKSSYESTHTPPPPIHTRRQSCNNNLHGEAIRLIQFYQRFAVAPRPSLGGSQFDGKICLNIRVVSHGGEKGCRGRPDWFNYMWSWPGPGLPPRSCSFPISDN